MDVVLSRFNVHKSDLSTLKTLFAEFDEDYTRHIILPLVQKNTANVSSVLAFLKAIVETSKDGNLGESTARTLSRDIVEQLIETFKIPTSQKVSKRPKLNDPTFRDPRPTMMTGGDHVKLLARCEALEMNHDVTIILNKIREQTLLAEPSAFEAFLLPILALLMLLSIYQGQPLRYQKLFRAVLVACNRLYVRGKPTCPRDLKRERRGCGKCKYCKVLDDFLIDGEEKSADFTCPRSVETTFGGSLRVYISLVKSQPPTSARMPQSHKMAFEI